MTASIWAASLIFSAALSAQETAQPASTEVMANTENAPSEEPAPKIPNDQLDSIVAPIALYPDPLVGQILAASTYPLEIIQLQQWMMNNKTLKDKALAEAVAKLPFDPSVQSLAAFPDVVKQLGDHVSWAMDLGNAFLAQQQDVMDAIQRMRAKAKGAGNLQTTAQQRVETETVDNEQMIVIEPADPDIVYVPQYSPTVVYGTLPVYPYPYLYPPGYGLLAFGAGVAMGAAWGGCWGNCDWHGGGDVTINNKNNFNKNNINNINRGQQNGKWQHNAQHRGGAPYGDRNTANKYGGRARSQSAGGMGNRGGVGGAGGFGGAGGLGGRQGIGGANRPGGGTGNFGGNRLGAGAGTGNIRGANRPGGGVEASTRLNGSTGISNRASGGSSFSGGDRIGNRSVSSGSGFGSSSNAFGGGGFGGGSVRSASSRGGYSMGGGGFSGGGFRGGGGGGGFRGGGGGGRRR
jgi:hypothetical protein